MKREPLDPQVLVDPEALAALLDGTLPEHERDEVLERLARSPGDFEAFVEAARVLRELEDESGAPPAPPAPPPVPPPASPPVREIRPARRGLPGAKLWLPLAAVLAGVLVVPQLLRDTGGEAQAALALLAGAPVVPGSGDASLTRALGADSDQPGWPVKRGSGDSLTDESWEFRIGVRLADLDAAIDAHDAPAMRAAAVELTRMVERLGPGAGSVAEDYPELGLLAADPRAGGGREAGVRAVEKLGNHFRDSAWLGLGIWVEQARLAALAGRVEHFADSDTRRVLAGLADSIQDEMGTAASVVGLLHDLQKQIGGGVSTSQLEAIRASLTGIVRESGS
jgi:hypothetical protein